MKVGLTGASGLVGRFLLAALDQAGHHVVTLGRNGTRIFSLGGEIPDLSDLDALIHAAFAHVPGRYRGGEGDDPARFRRLNLDGSVDLFKASRAAGVRRVLFLSSRAIFDGWPAGTLLTEDMTPHPTTLYGEVKAEAETVLAGLAGPGFQTGSLRATGIYGDFPGKWVPLFEEFARGRTPAPRVATELHGADLATGALLCLGDPNLSGAYHLSDIVLDRSELLAGWAARRGVSTPLPDRADATRLRRLDCGRMAALGWFPGGKAQLMRYLDQLA